MAQWARPGLRNPSMVVPPSLLIQKGQEQLATGLLPRGMFAPTPATSYARESLVLDAPAAEAVNYMEWWQQMHVHAPAEPSEPADNSGAAANAAARGDRGEQQRQQEPRWGMSYPGMTVHAGITLQSPFSSSIQHAQRLLPDIAATPWTGGVLPTVPQDVSSGSMGVAPAGTKPLSRPGNGVHQLSSSRTAMTALQQQRLSQQLASTASRFMQPLNSEVVTDEPHNFMPYTSNSRNDTGNGTTCDIAISEAQISDIG